MYCPIPKGTNVETIAPTTRLFFELAFAVIELIERIATTSPPANKGFQNEFLFFSTTKIT